MRKTSKEKCYGKTVSGVRSLAAAAIQFKRGSNKQDHCDINKFKSLCNNRTLQAKQQDPLKSTYVLCYSGHTFFCLLLMLNQCCRQVFLLLLLLLPTWPGQQFEAPLWLFNNKNKNAKQYFVVTFSMAHKWMQLLLRIAIPTTNLMLGQTSSGVDKHQFNCNKTIYQNENSASFAYVADIECFFFYFLSKICFQCYKAQAIRRSFCGVKKEYIREI